MLTKRQFQQKAREWKKQCKASGVEPWAKYWLTGGYTNVAVYQFERFDTDGTRHQYVAACEVTALLIDANMAKSGAFFVHGSLDLFYGNIFNEFENKQRINNVKLTVAIRMLQEWIGNTRCWQAEMLHKEAKSNGTTNFKDAKGNIHTAIVYRIKGQTVYTVGNRAYDSIKNAKRDLV